MDWALIKTMDPEAEAEAKVQPVFTTEDWDLCGNKGAVVTRLLSFNQLVLARAGANPEIASFYITEEEEGPAAACYCMKKVIMPSSALRKCWSDKCWHAHVSYILTLTTSLNLQGEGLSTSELICSLRNELKEMKEIQNNRHNGNFWKTSSSIYGELNRSSGYRILYQTL